MSDFEDVYSRITFDEDFGDAEVAEIKAALELIYSSSLGKGLLDKIGSLKIDKNLDGGNHGIHSTSTLEIDKNEIAILKSGDLEEIGIFICAHCGTPFQSHEQMMIHQRMHYIF